VRRTEREEAVRSVDRAFGTGVQIDQVGRSVRLNRNPVEAEWGIRGATYDRLP